MPSGAGDQFKFPEPQPLTHSIVPVLLRITREWIFCHIPDPSSPSSSAGCHILLCWSHGREPCGGTLLSSSHPLHQHWEGSPGCWCFHAAPSGGEQGLQGPSCSSLLLSGAQDAAGKAPLEVAAPTGSWESNQTGEMGTTKSLPGAGHGPGDAASPAGAGGKPG